jgi:phage tail sheath protein FI
MPEYLAPGVFIEEIDSGSKPIEGVGINTAAFIGYAKSGDYNTPTFVTNWSQFCQIFGQEENSLIKALGAELGMTVSEVFAAKRAARKGWMEFAQAAIQHALRDGSGKKRPAVKSFQELLRKYQIPQSSLPYMDGGYLAHAVRGYYDNGGTRAYIVRVARPEDIEVLSNGGGGARAAETPRLAAVAAQAALGPMTFKALKAGPEGNTIRVEVQPTGEGEELRVQISQGDVMETFGHGKEKPLTPGSVASAVNERSKLVTVETKRATALKVEPVVFTLEGGLEAAAVPVRAAGDTSLAPAGSPLSNGLANLRADDFLGDEAQRTGLGGLVPIEDINMLCIPDLMAGVWRRETVPEAGGAGGVGEEVLALDEKRQQSILDLQCALVAYCEQMGDRMAILDPIPGLSPQQMRDVTLGTPYNSDHGQGTIYYPWIKTVDPMRRGQQMFVPPCGHIAGVWARVGVERGVHKAPANESLRGVVGLETYVTKGEQEILNPEGINCIRSFPGIGIRIWGARTLATVGNPSWKYVNVRRLFNYLEKSMDRGLQWVVFEPNDHDLWGRVRRNLAAFLWTEWKEGKLFGTVPEEAYYVKCDAETNPQEMIDLGRLYVEIGVNPVKPAEFVIVRIGQWTGGGALAEQ